ncbi:peptidase S41 [Pedobacter sp. BAL39]|nr:peptidase S41 [Pedobacter sp. BAL39]
MLLLLFCSLITNAQQNSFNIDAEKLDKPGGHPVGWIFGFNDEQRESFIIKLDSNIKQSGKHSISIAKASGDVEFCAIDYPIAKVFQGSQIQLKAYLKTENIFNGYAGLWMRMDGKQSSIAFDNMSKRGVKGTTDWQQYTIDVDYNGKEARSIHIGALLVGGGKLWVDGFELLIDGKPIADVAEGKPVLIKADLDTAFTVSSGITEIRLNDKVQRHLLLAGQFWGFLKYHHPAIAKGEHNWDAELFRHLPKVIAVKNDAELSDALESWLDQVTDAPLVRSGKKKAGGKIAISPDYGLLFGKSGFKPSLQEKLENVRQAQRPEENYYISTMPNIGNPKFDNEREYAKMAYPDAGFRLLALYRYWTMINYFFPYKDVIGRDWNEALATAIPEFVQAKDETAYMLATLKLIASIHDTHANIWSGSKALNDFKGKYKAPFKGSFIENQLVVKEFMYGDTLEVKQKFHIGDVITSINGKPVTELIKYYLPYTAASNYDTQLRDMPGNFLLRSNSESFTFEILRNGKTTSETIASVPLNYYNKNVPLPILKAYKLLEGNIGYVYPGSYKNTDLPAIIELFKDTKGIIVDMRCYPSDFMPFTFGKYLKSSNAPFVKFTGMNVSEPGLFTFSEDLENGNSGSKAYKGKVVVMVDASSQSQAEYTTMAFQSAKNVKVIGSTTAGADGNVSQIMLPGGIRTIISGLGIFYPDGTPTQRVGVKIDKEVRPTIKGLIEERDELLEAAKVMINAD